MTDQARVIFSTGSLYPLDISHCFDLAAEAGFDGIEIMCDHRFSTRDPRYLNEQSARTGLPVLVVHTPFSATAPGWQAKGQLALIEHTIRLAEAVGAESMVVHLPVKVGRARLEAGRKTLIVPWFNGFREVKQWMANGGLKTTQSGTPVRIAIENMPRIRAVSGLPPVNIVHWNNIEGWSRVHDHLTLDTTHWATHGIDPLDAYRAAGERVAHVHLSNYDGREHRLPHRGNLDLGAFLRALAADHYTGTVCLELHPEALEFADTARLRQNLRESLDFIREHLA